MIFGSDLFCEVFSSKTLEEWNSWSISFLTSSEETVGNCSFPLSLIVV